MANGQGYADIGRKSKFLLARWSQPQFAQIDSVSQCGKAHLPLGTLSPSNLAISPQPLMPLVPRHHLSEVPAHQSRAELQVPSQTMEFWRGIWSLTGEEIDEAAYIHCSLSQNPIFSSRIHISGLDRVLHEGLSWRKSLTLAQAGYKRDPPARRHVGRKFVIESARAYAKVGWSETCSESTLPSHPREPKVPDVFRGVEFFL